MPKSVFKGAFSELKNRGYLFTPAQTVTEFISNEYPVRLATSGPTSQQKNVLSTGPFAISREFYECYFLRLKLELSLDTLGVLMTFKRVEHEKVGAFLDVQSTNIQADEETFLKIAQMSGIYDLSKPYVYRDFVWFDVTDRFKLEGKSELEHEQNCTWMPD